MSIIKQDFEHLDLPQLLLNIWHYRQASCKSNITQKYLFWCTEIARTKWKPEYCDFEDTIPKIYLSKTEYIDLSDFISITRHQIYPLLISDSNLYKKTNL